MTRAERKKAKEDTDKVFMDSLKGKPLSSKEKEKFRSTSIWKNFKKSFTDLIDPISLKRLPKRWQLHHMDLNPCNYTELRKKDFVPLNGTTHAMVHYLYGIYRHDKGVLKRLKRILDVMIKLNDGKDISDFKKVSKARRDNG